MKNSRPKALFFDAAGTLIDLSERVPEVYARHFSEAGFPTKADALSSSLRTHFETLPAPIFTASEPGDVAERRWWQTLVARVFQSAHPTAHDFLESPQFEDLFNKLFHHYESPSAWTIFADTIPALERASTRARLGVLSNFDHRLLPILKGLDLADYFEHILSSSDAKARKPDRKSFHHALETFQLAPHEVAHAGDSPEADYLGAQNSGIQGFLVSRPKTDLLDFLASCGIEAK